ncbi:uncharacterized protein M421DRAFT_322095 [Didymella exigua CBS 183.55]|uniref:Uncharacterized protein n=1 Tax=Didymella exigua CBS 183.55 TaxID=1150837 RepID=A0A6A5RTP0_9PLEO|nr:uncharacterized protein M421DRAFT_322095 [Didymella exigua CBS 183.55]KAF1931855.1 hypothetical protein M421DRAFT_322095 [Didymella exigua CBS 183.55]
MRRSRRRCTHGVMIPVQCLSECLGSLSVHYACGLSLITSRPPSLSQPMVLLWVYSVASRHPKPPSHYQPPHPF